MDRRCLEGVIAGLVLTLSVAGAGMAQPAPSGETESGSSPSGVPQGPDTGPTLPADPLGAGASASPGLRTGRESVRTDRLPQIAPAAPRPAGRAASGTGSANAGDGAARMGNLIDRSGGTAQSAADGRAAVAVSRGLPPGRAAMIEKDGDRSGRATGEAFDTNARAFTQPSGRPVVALVLLDTGGPPVDTPLTVSVAIDTGLSDAAARAASYRARGYEVLIVPRLPRRGAAQDVEQALQVSLRTLEGAVAVLPDPRRAARPDRVTVETLVGRLAETGHGLLAFSGGLDGAPRIAARAGVAAGIVFRDLDADDPDADTLARRLDRAAFRAAQRGALILLARNRPGTGAALAEWRRGDRAGNVVLSPVSAAIRAQLP